MCSIIFEYLKLYFNRFKKNICKKRNIPELIFVLIIVHPKIPNILLHNYCYSHHRQKDGKVKDSQPIHKL